MPGFSIIHLPMKLISLLLITTLLFGCQNNISANRSDEPAGMETALAAARLTAEATLETSIDAAQPIQSPSPTHTPAFENTELPTPESTPQPQSVASTPEAELTSQSTANLEEGIPDEYYITGIYGHKQYFPLGCEASVAVDWASFFGYTINEFNFQYELPLSDNPDKGFVGDVRSPWGQVPPYGYGIHAGPVADLLQEYGLPAIAVKEFTLEGVKAELAAGQPLIAWVIGNMVGGIPTEYTDKEGDTAIVAAYEHVVLVTGYNADSIRYNSNGKFYDTPTEVFLNSWNVLGNMAIIYGD